MDLLKLKKIKVDNSISFQLKSLTKKSMFNISN